MTLILNVCLKYKKIPNDWKESVPILIPKKGDLGDITNWLPVAMCWTIYKLYMVCIADSPGKWSTIKRYLNSKKGLCRWTSEYVHTLNRLVQKTREAKSERCIAWPDVSNAFGAVPHMALTSALTAMGSSVALTEIVTEAYDGTSSHIAVGNGTSRSVEVR